MCASVRGGLAKEPSEALLAAGITPRGSAKVCPNDFQSLTFPHAPVMPPPFDLLVKASGFCNQSPRRVRAACRF
jgi:hypothetical protein